MVERPANLRAARSVERTHNSRRHQAEAGGEESRNPDHAYRGSHRAERSHRADERVAADRRSAADRRGSRVGRHHADQSHPDHQNQR